MATINTIEDLVQILDDNPKWLEAVRARLLTREVLEMPHTLDRLDGRVDKLDGRVDKLDGRMDKLDGRMDRLDGRMDRLDGRMDRLDGRMDLFEERTDRRFDRLDANVQSIRDDLGVLKGAHARNAAIEDAGGIVSEMGLRLTKTLTRGDVLDLINTADTTGIPANELRSFRAADLIMEARDGEGAPCYVAAEVSFTVNGRDTSRAIRNADFLSRFTGRRSYPAVVGAHRDDRVREAIESGEVFWYRLDPHRLGAE